MSDISAVTKYIATANEGFTTTLNGDIAANAPTVTLTSVAGLIDASVFVGIIEPGDASRQQVFTGTVDVANSRLTGVVWTRGSSPSGHANGVQIVDYVTGTAFNMLGTGFLKQHLQNGQHGNVTATSLASSGGLSVTGGSVTLPNGSVNAQSFNNPYKFSVYLNTDTALPASTVTKVPFNVKKFDTNNNFDLTNRRYVAPVTGTYWISAQVATTIAGASPGIAMEAYITVNGATAVQSTLLDGSGNDRRINRPSMNKLLQLNAGDYVESMAYCQEGGRFVNGYEHLTFMTGFLVSTV